MTPAGDPAAQARYQVRFDQGAEGARRIAGAADVLVWVDQVADAAPDGEAAPPVPAEALAAAPGAAVLVAGLRDAAAAAAWILADQERLGRRSYLAIVAAGRADGGFAADDVLAAGAVVDALTELGIDDTSPEAAVASFAYAGLRRAVAHLATASVAGREAVAAGVDPAVLRRAAARDEAATARVVRER
ncbi:2-phosphosulfolactate phosphatase [Agromyces aurantiacus]|uniref:2-phosphosulfolactate phosphatase n=1 Tax=Agromyces aurantiacus TaxID=165814 RepID=A0ABV9R1B6_9MICO|nr:2-phosphosulfolactate phosphatase [Agromyces aurantiacus]